MSCLGYRIFDEPFLRACLASVHRNHIKVASSQLEISLFSVVERLKLFSQLWKFRFHLIRIVHKMKQSQVILNYRSQRWWYPLKSPE